MKYTNQTAFETSARHLLKQNAVSIVLEPFPMCAFRGLEGNMCPIGCLIPDDKYKPNMEGKALRDLNISELDNVNIGLLSWLMIVHEAKPVHTWPDELKKVGEIFGLDTSFIIEAPSVRSSLPDTSKGLP